MNNLDKLKEICKGRLALTPREESVLAVAVTQMIQAGLDPFTEKYPIEIA